MSAAFSKRHHVQLVHQKTLVKPVQMHWRTKCVVAVAFFIVFPNAPDQMSKSDEINVMFVTFYLYISDQYPYRISF